MNAVYLYLQVKYSSLNHWPSSGKNETLQVPSALDMPVVWI